MAIEDEFLANVRYWLRIRSEGTYPRNDDYTEFFHQARGVRLNGGDPARMLLQLEGYAQELGEIETIQDLRRKIVAEWIAEEERERRISAQYSEVVSSSVSDTGAWVVGLLIAIPVLLVILSQCS